MTMKSFRLIPCLLLSVALAFGSVGCVLLPEEEELLAPPLKEPAKITYDTVEVKKYDSLANDLIKTAYFQSSSTSDAYFTVQPGKLYKMNVRVNDTVKKGDILCELENDAKQDAVNEQKLRLSALKIDLDALKIKANGGGSLEKQKVSIDIMKQELKDLEADYQAAVNAVSESEKVRIQKLIDAKNNAIRLAEMDYQNALKDAKDAYAKAQINYKMAEDTLAKLQQQLDACLLRAPISGVVTFVKSLSVGDNISTYDTVASISDPNSLVIWCSAGTAKDKLKTGTKLVVSLAGSDTAYTATVIRTWDEMTKDEKRAAGQDDLAIIKMDKTPPGVKVGDPVTLRLRIWEVKNVIAVETYLINDEFKPNRYTVRLLEGDIPVERDVVPAFDANGVIMQTATMTVIEGGLEVGDQIVK